MSPAGSSYVKWFSEVGLHDVAQVGGKNSSLGELIKNLTAAGVRVPNGFATTAEAYRDFLNSNSLVSFISQTLKELDVEDTAALRKAGSAIRERIAAGSLPKKLEEEISQFYATLQKEGGAESSVAVRSSATAEDLAEASFAGQQETFLNISGEANLLSAIKEVYASLYNDRAIAYRAHHGFAGTEVALSVGVQLMVRSDQGASGVMFTVDTESGFDKVVFITSSYGLGELIVQGAVNPDEFYVYKPALEAGRPAIIRRQIGEKQSKMIFSRGAGSKPVTVVEVEQSERMRFSLSDSEVEELARYGTAIERHYGRPMDIEWGKDGEGRIFILQARPETITARTHQNSLTRYEVGQRSKILVSGRAIGQKVGQGRVCTVNNAREMDRVKEGDVLVTDMTDPDWEPVMKRSAAIVTNRGGRTCHAAIVARELGIPAIVGCGDATERLKDGQEVTVSCAEGDTGNVYEGRLTVNVSELALDSLPPVPVKITLNVANPERAFEFQKLPNAGIGLARLEFIIARTIGVHPSAALEFSKQSEEVKTAIRERSAGYPDPVTFYVEKLAEGIGTIAAAFAPKPVIFRLSDFKSNEYSALIGGERYEPREENPMIGFRGASRYIASSFEECFALECQAVRKVRDEIGLTNVEVMIPFVRTVSEAKGVVEVLASHGLERGKNGLRLIMMCEIPSNALLADQFLEYLDGFSIGSNDLTQLTLGLDRDSGLVAGAFDERDEAVKALLRLAISACRKHGKYIGICGQGPSDHPDFAEWLVSEGIDSVSLNPDTVVETWLRLAKMAPADAAAADGQTGASSQDPRRKTRPINGRDVALSEAL